MTQTVVGTNVQSSVATVVYQHLEVQENVEDLLDTLYVLITNLGIVQGDRDAVQKMAHELLGEVIKEALTHGYRYDPGISKPRTWLNGIARNIAKRKKVELNQLYKREQSFSDLQHRQGVLDDDAFFDQFIGLAVAGPEQDVETMEQFEIILSLATENNQRLLRLYILHDFDATRLAQVLNIKPETARQRICRALKQLRAILEKQKGEPNG
jgi:RNA polymerase sigma factor (sigma-70 family)